MKLNEEQLRKDLLSYTETAISLKLSCAAESTEQVEKASEAELVDLAATEGWDLGRYVTEE